MLLAASSFLAFFCFKAVTIWREPPLVATGTAVKQYVFSLMLHKQAPLAVIFVVGVFQ